MSHDDNGRSELFPVLEPPRGGLPRLRARIERDTRRRARTRRLVAASAVLAALLLASLPLLRPPAEPDPLEAGFRMARMRLGLEPPPGDILSISDESRARAAVLRVPLESDRVVLYHLAFAE